MITRLVNKLFNMPKTMAIILYLIVFGLGFWTDWRIGTAFVIYDLLLSKGLYNITFKRDEYYDV